MLVNTANAKEFIRNYLSTEFAGRLSEVSEGSRAPAYSHKCRKYSGRPRIAAQRKSIGEWDGALCLLCSAKGAGRRLQLPNKGALSQIALRALLVLGRSLVKEALCAHIDMRFLFS